MTEDPRTEAGMTTINKFWKYYKLDPPIIAYGNSGDDSSIQKGKYYNLKDYI